MKKFLFMVGLSIAISISALGSVVFADEFGLDATAGAAHLNTYGSSVPTIAGNIIGTLLSMISVLFFVLVLYGGILWMTARGNSEQTSKALDTIIAAVIGIIIIMGAYALTNFVFKLGGSNSGGGESTSQTTLTCTPACTGNTTCVNGACVAGGGDTPSGFICKPTAGMCSPHNNDATACDADPYCVSVPAGCLPRLSSPCSSHCGAGGECTESQKAECLTDVACEAVLP